MIRDILPALIFARGKRARPKTNIVLPAPVSFIVPRLKTGSRVIGNLVMLVAGSFEHGHREFEKSRFNFVLRAKLAKFKACQKLGVLFVGQAVSRNVLRLERDRSFK